MKNKNSNNINLASAVTSEIVAVTDAAGNIISKTVRPLVGGFYIRDVLQQIIGATLLAVPLSYTEEVWKLGEQLPAINIYLISVVSLLFISAFAYYNFYRKNFNKRWFEFLQRVLSTYFVSLCVSFLILILIDRAPMDLFWTITIKRMILISLPASMSASIADIIK